MTTVEEGAGSLALDLPADASTTVGSVRRWLVGVLDGLGEDHLYDVQLIVTELVSNVYDHAPGPGQLRVAHHTQPCRVSVEVDDSSTALPVRGRSRLGGSRGRGIVVVESVSVHWGVRPLPEGKTVWAVVDCTG
ncbi:ATP-binding protein [Lentzea jiangxiensis]|uniref:Anti-sigma regulatory factor (Ser/Thr protein kinase) n=1 Tax=Lentzea jiangxiensis TaxID=641025 RepID=A0A1H0KXA9_9PSEU|nr:ATP-binding protein [Lentzea jiangxiensis]SDO60607.1 Anti-sigma regulatory factor (Ser/Thr protein kinase) [Lentzea jiangxiensis]